MGPASCCPPPGEGKGEMHGSRRSLSLPPRGGVNRHAKNATQASNKLPIHVGERAEVWGTPPQTGWLG